MLLFACTEHQQGTEAPIAETPKADTETVKSQSVSEDYAVTIGPVGASAQTIIYLRADNSLLNKGEIQWYVNNIYNSSVTGVRFTSSELRKGDVVHAKVIKNRKAFLSNELIIKNTPPVISKANLLPQAPKISSRLTVDITAEDADRDRIFFKYKWYLNDTFAGEENYLNTELKKGDNIMVEVTPFDDEEPGKSIRLKTSVSNTLPVFMESTPSFDGKLYKYQIKATDPDGDNLSYTLKEAPSGMTIDSAKGLITWEVPSGNAVPQNIKVLISDNHGGEVLVPFTLKIAPIIHIP